MLNLNEWQGKLEQEQRELEAQLTRIGRVNPQNKNDWEVRPLEAGATPAEAAARDDVADELEELDEREEIENELEHRLREVKSALKRLSAGTYGLCEIGGESIEEERLKANPAARTCKAHLAEEKNLN